MNFEGVLIFIRVNFIKKNSKQISKYLEMRHNFIKDKINSVGLLNLSGVLHYCQIRLNFILPKLISL